MKTPSEGKLLRIFVGEADQWEGRPLYQAIIELARAEKMSGATAIKGFMGFGANSHMHTAKLLRLSEDLPVVIEIVDSEKNIAWLLPKLDLMIQDGLVTIEKINVLMYRADGAPKRKKR